MSADVGERKRADPIAFTAIDPLRFDGDDAAVAVLEALYSKHAWWPLTRALNDADHGRGERLQRLADAFSGRRPDGSFRPPGPVLCDQRTPSGASLGC